MTHYWDCSGQGCDAATLQPWNETRYISPPGYGPQDPVDFGGSVYGEAMWLSGAASDALSELMGDDDGCCGGDPNDGGVGGCGKCLLVQNDNSLHPDWTAVVMKKNRCPPHSHGCGAGEPHFDIAAPGFDNLAYSTANVCGQRPGTGFDSKEQSAALGSWWQHGCANTAGCIHLCDQLPAQFIRGCRLFASWGWKRGDPTGVKYKAVACPQRFVQHIGAQFGPDGAVGGDTPPTPAPTPSPTPAPTPSPTPAPTPGPTCELDESVRTCAAQGGTFECQRCTAAGDFAGEPCCECHGGEEPETTTETTLTATTTTATATTLTTSSRAAEPCKAWCASHTTDWGRKCRWRNCRGCAPCSARRLRGSEIVFP